MSLEIRIATFILWVSFIFLAVVVCIIIFQLLRRLWMAKHADQHEGNMQEQLSQLTSALFASNGQDPHNSGKNTNELAVAVDNVSLTVIAQVLTLLRGGERDRLLRAVAQSQNLAQPIKQLHRGNVTKRMRAMRILESFDCETSFAALQQVLDSRNPQIVRETAAYILARNGVPIGAARLIKSLNLGKNPPSLFHCTLFREIATHDCGEIFDLIDLADYIPLKAALIRALGYDLTLGVLPALERWADHAESDIRLAALTAATKLRHPSSLPWIKSHFSDESIPVRLAAITAFRQIAPAADAHELAAFTAERDPTVFAAAAESAQLMARSHHHPRNMGPNIGQAA